MNITVLGKYGPFAINGSTSSYLVEQNNKYCLLDVGSGAVNKLLKITDLSNLSFIFLSHLHFDHISDIGVLSYAINFLRIKKGLDKIDVYLPNGNSLIVEQLSKIAEFNLIFIEENKTYEKDNFKFTFFKTTHPVLSYGIKFFEEEKSFLYSGDCSSLNDLTSVIKNVNLAILDGGFLENNSNKKLPHLSVDDIISISNENKVKCVVSHLSPLIDEREYLNKIKDSKYLVLAQELVVYKV